MKTSRILAVLAAAVLGGCSSCSTNPVIDSFTASPASIVEGNPCTLAWKVSGAQKLTIDNGVGVVTGSSKIVQPLQTTTYTLTAEGKGGVSHASATVTVAQPSSNKPTIQSFTATPPSTVPGGAVTLAWAVKDATSLEIDNGIGVVTGKTQASATVDRTTTFTLTAKSAAGSVTASVKVDVPAPVIGSFTATPPRLAAGGKTTLAWTVTGAKKLELAPGLGDVTGKSSLDVTPPGSTVYTLTATNDAGAVTANVEVAIVPRFVYYAPTGGKVRLVSDPAASTDTSIVLRLETAVALDGYGVALDLPIDTAKAKFDPATFSTAAGALDPGSAPPAAAAQLGTAGRVAGVLVAAVSQKAAGAGAIATDTALSAGAKLFTVTLTLDPNAPAGFVFDGDHLGPKFRGQLSKRDGTVTAGSADFAIGRLVVER